MKVIIFYQIFKANKVNGSKFFTSGRVFFINGYLLNMKTKSIIVEECVKENKTFLEEKS